MIIKEIHLTEEALNSADHVLVTSFAQQTHPAQVILDVLAKVAINATEMGKLTKLESLLKEYAHHLHDVRDKEGWSLLHIAAYQGHALIVKLLLEHQFDTKCKNPTGWYPLHCAAYKGHFEIIEMLLARQGLINEADNEGWTPLHCAAYKGHKRVIKLLLTYGAKADARNQTGLTPSELALTHHKIDIPPFIASEVAISQQLTKQSIQTSTLPSIHDKNENHSNKNKQVPEKNYENESDNNNNTQSNFSKKVTNNLYTLGWFKQARTIIISQKILTPLQRILAPK